MNKKGQVLVAFLLLLPLVFLLLALLVDVGYFYQEKRGIDHAIKSAITDALTNQDESKVKEIAGEAIRKNIEDIDTLVLQYENKQLKVSVTKKAKRLFSSLLKGENQEIKLTYLGTILNDQVKIRKE